MYETMKSEENWTEIEIPMSRISQKSLLTKPQKGIKLSKTEYPLNR